MAQLNHIKQENNLDGILITDNKGFQIYNNGFAHPHNLHALKQLSSYFFPGLQGTIVGIETIDHTIIVRDVQDKIVATREAKESQ